MEFRLFLYISISLLSANKHPFQIFQCFMAQNPLDLAISAHKIARIIYFFVKITKTLSTLHHVNAIPIQLFNVLKRKIKAKIQERR